MFVKSIIQVFCMITIKSIDHEKTISYCYCHYKLSLYKRLTHSGWISIQRSKIYKNAHDIKWDKQNDTYYASFYLKNTDVTVAFSEDGEILAESRDVEITNLPPKISASLSANFKGYVFNNQATEVKFQGTHTYFVIGQDQNFWVRLRYNTDGSYDVVKKIRQ